MFAETKKIKKTQIKMSCFYSELAGVPGFARYILRPAAKSKPTAMPKPDAKFRPTMNSHEFMNILPCLGGPTSPCQVSAQTGK